MNHYRNDRELCRKDLLVKNLKKYKRQLSKADPEEVGQATTTQHTTTQLHHYTTTPHTQLHLPNRLARTRSLHFTRALYFQPHDSLAILETYKT